MVYERIKIYYPLNNVCVSYCVTIAVIIHAFHRRKVNYNEKAVRFITFDVFSFVQPTRCSINILFFICVIEMGIETIGVRACQHGNEPSGCKRCG
jgi:hypothetical protein